MSAPLQIKDMDAQQIAERHFIERYLAGQLTEEEALAFEAYVETHPEIIAEIETVARMKAGLGALQARGELASLLAAPRVPWHRKPAVMAASIVGVLLVSLLVVRPWREVAEPASMVATLQDLVGQGGNAPSLASRILLTRTRSLIPLSIEAKPDNSALEVTLDSLAADSAGTYAVSLWRVTEGKLQPVGEVAGLRPDNAGQLTLFVRSEFLRPGDYLFKVHGRDASEASEFALHVKPSSEGLVR